MYHDSLGFWKHLLKQGLDEDGWQWDWTTLGISSQAKPSIRAEVIAKSEGVWAASDLVKALSQFSDENGVQVCAQSEYQDGQKLVAGSRVMTLEGSSRLVLALERPFLNLASYVSGIATSTRRLVDQVKSVAKGQAPRVTSTRKILPGYRDLAIHGVRAGGGYAHRVSLSGGVLIKENHIAAAGGIEKAIRLVSEQAPHGLKIEVEVRSLSELSEALSSGAEAVLLDNFTPRDVVQAVVLIRKHSKPIVVEVSGGLSEENIAEFVIEGVHVLSSGSLTHSVKAVDLSLLVK